MTRRSDELLFEKDPVGDSTAGGLRCFETDPVDDSNVGRVPLLFEGDPVGDSTAGLV